MKPSSLRVLSSRREAASVRVEQPATTITASVRARTSEILWWPFEFCTRALWPSREARSVNPAFGSGLVLDQFGEALERRFHIGLVLRRISGEFDGLRQV
jgi:hypothetical protein